MAKQMDNTIKYLETVENRMVKAIQKILTTQNRNASHRLYNSISMSLSTNNNGFLIKLEYADHGKYVLDSTRRVKKNNPSGKAIEEIKKWITNKGISVGRGRIRTPLKSKSGKQEANIEARKSSRDKELTSFAWAIWKSIKKNGKIKTPRTDFLLPYNNLVSSNKFQTDLAAALAKDTITMIGGAKNIKLFGKNNTIKIKI